MDDETLSTGEFSHRTRLSRKALRVYARTGLLCPVEVDPGSGYRRYAAGQVRAGQIIAALRGAGLGLTEIGPVIADLDADRSGAISRLEQAIVDARRRHEDSVLVIRHVQTTLHHGGDPMYPIQTRHVPARRLMTMQRRLRAREIPAFAAEAECAFTARLIEAGAEPIGPFSLIYLGWVDEANDEGTVEAAIGCPDGIEPDDRIGVRHEPAHDEAYTTITRRQLQYPAILAAYDAVACCAELRARPGSTLSCREVYCAVPDECADCEPVCDVAFPLGDAPGAGESARP